MGFGDDMAALAAAPPAPREPAAPAAPGGGFGDMMAAKAANPVGTTLDEELQRGSNWQQASDRLKSLGVSPDDHADKKKYFDLSEKRNELSVRGMSASQVYRSQYQPFGDLVTLPEKALRPLDYVSRELGRLGGKEQDIGGRVVGNREYQEATQRFQAGSHTADDIDAIATYERHNQLRQQIAKSANFAEKFAMEAGGLGKLVQETMAGGKLLRGAGAVLRPAAAAAPALAGAAPALPAAASFGAKAATLATNTVATPAMYVPLMQQANLRAGREANDVRGLPTSFGYALANMAVLGRLGSPAASAQGSAAMAALRKGAFGVAEMQSVDLAAGLADQVLDKNWQIKGENERWGNVGAWLRAGRAGDRDAQSETLRDVAIQTLTFSAFAALHGRDTHATDLTQSFADTVGRLRESGMSKTRAGEVIGDMHVRLEDALSANPYLSREQARDALGKDLHADLKPYADKLVDTFEPQAALPTAADVAKTAPAPGPAAPPEPASPVPQPPEPGSRVQYPARPAGDLSNVTAVDPTAPDPARQVTLQHSDGSVSTVAPAAAAAPAAGDVSAPRPVAPTVLGAGTATPPAERAAAVQDRIAGLEAKLAEAAAAVTAARGKAGGSLSVLNGLKRNQEAVARQIVDAKRELAAVPRQPLPPAATDSKAPSVAAAASESPPSNTPAEPAKPAAAATAAPAAAPEAAVQTAAQRRAAARAKLASAAAAPADTRTDVKARYKELVDQSPLRADVKADHVARFHALVDKLPDAAVDGVNANLSHVEAHASVYDVTNSVLQAELAAAKRSGGDAARIENDIEAMKRGLLTINGAVDAKGVLRIDGHDHGPADAGHYGMAENPRAEAVLAHEAGHLVDGNLRRTHSGSGAWERAYNADVVADVGGVPKLSAYAQSKGSSPATAKAEGFAEFFRLVHGSEVGHAEIAEKFPAAADYFKANGLWPAAERLGGKDARLSEVFNERIPTAGGGHGDAWRFAGNPHADPQVHADATASGREAYNASLSLAGDRATAKLAGDAAYKARVEATAPKKSLRAAAAAGPKAGGKATPKPEPKAAESGVEPEAAPDWRKLDRSDFDGDGRVLNQLADTYPADSRERDYLESAAHNATAGSVRLHGKDARRQTLDALHSVLTQAQRAGHADAEAAVKKAIAHFGGTLVGERGKTVPFDPTAHTFKDGDAGVPVGDPVTVEHEGVSAHNDGKYDRSYLADAPPRQDTVQKAVVASAPAAAAAPAPKPAPRKFTADEMRQHWQDQFDSMDADDKAAVKNDPALRKQYADNGVDLSSRGQTGRRGAKQRAVEGLDGFKDDVRGNANLSASEREALLAMLDGKSGREIGKKLSVSHTTVQRFGERALDKMKRDAAGWEGFDSLQDVVAGGVREAARQQQLALNTELRSRQEKEASYDPAGDEAGGLGVQPFRLSRLAGMFARPGGVTPWQRLSAAFFGGLPEAAKAAKEQEIDGQIAAYAFDVKTATADFAAAVKAEHKPYEALSQAELKNLDAVLRGDAAARTGVGPKTLAALDVMRGQVDKLSEKLIASGAIDTPLVAAVTGNVGSYLTRQYQVFRDPKWESKVDPAVVNRFKSWLTNQLTAAGKSPTAADVDAITKNLLRDGTAAENPIAFLRTSTLGAKDLSILRSRKAIPDELRALWGEYEDPLVNYANSVAKMSHLLTTQTFLNRVTAEGQGKFFFDKPTSTADGEHVVQISSEGNPALDPLGGKYTTPEVKAAFEKTFAKGGAASVGMQWYMKALAAAKFSKTILSHVGQMHNFLSNVLIAVRNGHFDVAKFPAAFEAIRKDTPEARTYWRNLVARGVVGDGVGYNDFRKTLDDAAGGREYFQGTGGNPLMNSVLGRTLRAAGSKAAALYNYGDAIWKIHGFENEKQKYVETGMPAAEAEAKAAEIVRDTMPTYSKLAPGLQALRKAPLAAPFIAFQAEMVRTTKNTLKLAVAELRDPKTRAVGAQRMAGVMLAATLPAAAAAATRALFGVSSKEEDDMRRFVPEWQKNSRFVYFGRDAAGMPRYTDLSKMDPHSYLSDGLVGFMRGKTASEGIENAAGEWAKPFTQEELLVKPAIDVARNKTDRGGAVYNPTDTAAGKIGASAQHVGDAFTPAAYAPVNRLRKALAGEPDQKSGQTYTPADSAAENLTGTRIQSVRVREDLAGKALGFEKAKKDADKMVADMIHAKGNVSPQQLEAARQSTEAARKKTMDEFKRDVDAAESLGLSRQEVAMILRTAGLSVGEVGQLFSGTRQPYLPELKGTATERVRAGEVRKSAYPARPASQP